MSEINNSGRRFPGDRIKAERKRLVKTQAQISALCGVERETWSRYESDKLEIGNDVFRKFVAAGADADYLMTGALKGEEHLTPAAQMTRMRVMACCLVDELHQAKTGLSYEMAWAVLDGIAQSFGQAPDFDVPALRTAIKAQLR